MSDSLNYSTEILASISVDCVIFGYFESELTVLVRKEFVPLNGAIAQEWKLPGNHINREEDIYDTAARILKEQTGLEDIFMKQFMVFSDPQRLKRRPQDFEWVKPRLIDDRVITVAFYSLVNVKSVDSSKLIEIANWENVNTISDLMFDHKNIIDEALVKLRYDLLHEPLIFELLPQKFTLTQMQNVYEVIFNTVYDKRNFRRKINKMDYLIPLSETQKGVSHKPARYYSFDREIYENTRTQRCDFGM